MTILITGVTGTVGSRFARRLRDRGEPVRVLVRTEAAAEGWPDAIVGDLRDESTRVRAVDGVDAVVHIAAAFRNVPDDEAFGVNRDATIALAETALKAGVTRFVFTSTGLVYGRGQGRPALEGDAWGDGSPLSGAYPDSKREAEAALLAMPGLGLRIVRLAYVYGEGDPHLAQSLRWAARWATHQRLHLVHHADAGQGLWLALQADGVDGRTYNIADDAPITAWELHLLNGAEMPVVEGVAVDDPWWGVLSTERARRELGYRPLYPTAYSARDAGVL